MQVDFAHLDCSNRSTLTVYGNNLAMTVDRRLHMFIAVLYDLHMMQSMYMPFTQESHLPSFNFALYALIKLLHVAGESYCSSL